MIGPRLRLVPSGPRVRHVLEEWVGEGGHRLVPITRTVREVLERAGGANIKGRGVSRLFALATIGSRELDRIPRGEDLMALRAALQVAHVVDLFDEAPEAYLEALEAVGPYLSLDAATQAALGDGRGYQADVLLAAYRAASIATSRDAFDRLLGLTAAAHGPVTQTIRAWYVDMNTKEGFVRESALTWSDYRRALRKIFHRVKESRGARAAA